MTRDLPPTERYLNSIAETAQLLAVSERTVRRLISRDELSPVRANGRVLITRESIERFIARGGSRG